MTNIVHYLSDGREIEGSLQTMGPPGRRIRLRARLTEDGLIKEVMRWDWVYDERPFNAQIELFAIAFEKLIKTVVPRPFVLAGVRDWMVAFHAQTERRVCEDGVIVTGPPS